MAAFIRNDSETTPHDESSPLLSDHSCVEIEAQKPVQTQPTPLPKGQLAALCSIRVVDPIAFTQVFPYINEFITLLHLTDDPSRIGFYSGLVESIFAIAQLFSIYQWARISDVIGRRPVIITGTLGIAVTTVLLGLSSSLSEILLSRCIAGLFSGNVAVIHSVLGELTDSTNQAVAFPIYGLFWPLGGIIGPLIGGTFSNPVTKYPDYFQNSFWKTYPYFLPCLIAGVLALSGASLAYYFLEETLPSKRQNRIRRDSSPSGSYGATNGGTVMVSSPPPSIKKLLSVPTIRALSASGCALSFIATAFDVVFVLFCYSPIKTGGLAFSAAQIGNSLAIAGIIAAAIQLFFMPTILRTFDNVKTYSFCMGTWPFTFAALPVLNLIARNGLDEATGVIDFRARSLLWMGIGIILGCSRIGCLAYSVSMILVKESAPNPQALGSTNGLVQFAMCLSRAFSPAFVSSAFALSVEHHLLGGYMWAIVMVCVCFLGCWLARKISNHRIPVE